MSYFEGQGGCLYKCGIECYIFVLACWEVSQSQPLTVNTLDSSVRRVGGAHTPLAPILVTDIRHGHHLKTVALLYKDGYVAHVGRLRRLGAGGGGGVAALWMSMRRARVFWGNCGWGGVTLYS